MLDRDGPIPLYVQIAQIIKDLIKTGDLQAGDPMPSEAQIEAEYGVARTTARRVARELREQGLVYTVQGEGTFVGRPGLPRTRRKTPMYQQIANDIVERIRGGELAPNRPIASEKTLMQQYDVAKVTARQAVDYLRQQGWVFTVSYRGSYVTQPDKWPDGAGDGMASTTRHTD
ncbi:GntR family transcriptional regulator [Spongiactinospora sp. TRM90649]|uniref:GntR family transcriptional regulator n=1 Tax=Spongiactinospora sp. TRM90649 TaxID=3031114 RepID=UPI0023F70BFB|nr:GntR family transcriptional regulator [Spongiactinospora sp. TRM90649]MDF5754007.1 GntR family transcriptional regulator [Spongiactinospora sp. TRM90649]